MLIKDAGPPQQDPISASPIEINRPRLHLLVPISAQPDDGIARVQRPKARRSKTEPLLHRSARESDLLNLYGTFDENLPNSRTTSHEARNEERLSPSSDASDEVITKLPALKATRSAPGIGNMTAIKKKVTFAVDVDGNASSWSTVASGESMPAWNGQ